MKTIALITSPLVFMILTSLTVAPAPDMDPAPKAGTTEGMRAADPLIGEVIMFAGNFAPRGWEFCEGQLLAISSHPALFSLLGTQYGGDGRTTFALPKLESKNGVKYIIAIQGTYPSRN